MSKALRVLITGAARGIGMATAQVLANRGHSVVATDVSALSGLEGIQAHVLDVTSDDSVARCLEEVGPLDAIVNNAGITSGGGPVEGYPLDRFRQMFETNTLGALRVIQAVLPAWRKRGSGVIVNVSSVNGRVSSPLRAAYSASKFALEALTESLHLEVRHFGIRSVLIEPGAIATGIKPIEPHKGTSGIRRTLGAVCRSRYQDDGAIWSTRTRSCRISHRACNRRSRDTVPCTGRPRR
jgi:NAD(P)-dependent dehydrogenase (short-subunit alcohol dehydrogenase family)